MLGCTGHPSLKTPHIDRLASEGSLFRNFFDATPLCSPSRASYLSGVYPHRHDVVDNDKVGIDVISQSLMTFPRQAQEKGYKTAFIGKWHMGADDSRRPGFDRWVSFKGQGAYIDGVVNEDGVHAPARWPHDGLSEPAGMEWLKKKRTKPFCMIVEQEGGPCTLPASRAP